MFFCETWKKVLIAATMVVALCAPQAHASKDVVLAIASTLTTTDPWAVSYTHLDVYKRQTFYNADMAPALAVPYHFLLGSTPKELPAPAMQTPDGAALADVPKAIRERVLAILREESGVEVIEDTATLATDLGIDSLSLINVSVRLEEISGQPIEQLEALRTVGDLSLIHIWIRN